MKRWLTVLGIVAATVVMGGCFPEKRVVWSPDGRQAAVATDDGLYFCDEHGKLSERLAEGVRHVAWLPDSKRLIVERRVPAKSWDEATRALDAEYVRRLAALGDAFHDEALAHTGPWDKFQPRAFASLTSGEQAVLVLYVRDKRSEGMEEKLGEEWAKMKDLSVDVWWLEITAIEGGKLVTRPALAHGLDGFSEIAASPDGRTVAYIGSAPNVAPPESSPPAQTGVNRLNVFAVPTEGGGPPRAVNERSSTSLAWSADGRYLCFVDATMPTDGNKDAMCLGTVARRQVCGADGALLEMFGQPEELAGVIFHPQGTRVRCLRDGRIVFASIEVQLPCTAKDMPERATLFALDPERQPMVTRLIPRQAEADLPDGVFLFELSPDERHVCIPADNGRVVVLTLATGDVWEVAADKDVDELRTLPTWRSDDELCLNYGPAADKSGKRSEIVLCKVNWQTKQVDRRVLSEDWSAPIARGFLVKDEQPPQTEDKDAQP